MKNIIFFLLFLAVITACNSENESPKTAAPPVATKINLDDYPWAKEEIEEAIELCGPGVVINEEGKSSGENNCRYHVRIDKLLLTDSMRKTGLIHEPNWQFKEGVQFYKAPESVAIPDRLDLRDFMTGGKPDIRQQSCGDCWAWATHHGLEIARAVHDKTAVDYSSQVVLSCSGKGSCSGGYMSAVDFLKHGLALETEFPYTGRNSKCKFSKEEIETGWSHKAINTPWVGESKSYSRGAYLMPEKERKRLEDEKIENMMRAMVQWKSPLVVTVASFSVGAGEIYNSCSQVNSGGNHMVDISGFEMIEGVRVAHVWNSHGKGFGDQGVGKIKWQCPKGLNRGLGVEAKIVQYKSPCTPPVALIGKPEYQIIQGSAIKVGMKQPQGTKCSWLPTTGVEDPSSCETYLYPQKSTEYHLSVTNDCGTSSAMTLVRVLSEGVYSSTIDTIYGAVPDLERGNQKFHLSK